MLSEFGKVISKQMESHLKNGAEGVYVLEGVSDAQEISEISKKEIEEGVKILQPDMDLIKTQSLEAVKQSNLERTQASVKENNEFKELTEEEKQYLIENTKLSEKAIEKIYVDADGNYHLKCRNEELAGKIDEATGVKYVEKSITIGDNIQIIVVVPEFPAIFECEIPAEMWESGDNEIFKKCTEQLRDYLEAHPEMKSQFNERQLKDIMEGKARITGYTWHHNEIPGKMQLVESKIHSASGHTGGNPIWCKGIRVNGGTKDV